jgi:hypothetical protein
VIPHTKNHPPRIIEGSEDPGGEFALEVGPNCKPRTFKVSFEEADSADKVRQQWFIDPDTGFTTDFKTAAAVTPTNGRGVVSLSFEVTTGAGLGQVGLHRLTAVITDGTFTTDDQGNHTATEPRVVPAIDGGFIQEPTLTDSFTWIVDSQSASCPP